MVPLLRLARWLAASMPRARPETMTKPAAPRSRANRPAKRRPAAEALRAPTTATAGRRSAAVLPRTARSGGASSIICSRRGYSGSPSATNATPSAFAALSSRSASWREWTRAARLAPPRRARSGSAASAARALVDQRAEGARADVVAADEAQPIEPLLLAQPHAVAVFAHGMIRL